MMNLQRPSALFVGRSLVAVAAVVTIVVVALLVARDGTESPRETDSPALVPAAAPVAEPVEGPPDLFPNKSPEELTSADLDAIQAAYKDSNQLPVGDQAANIVGYVRWDDYYAPSRAVPGVYEVYSYADGSLVGHKADFLGFVPLEDYSGPDAMQRIADELLAPRLELETQRQAAFNESLAELTPDEIADYIDQARAATNE